MLPSGVGQQYCSAHWFMLPTRAKKWNKGVEETRFCQWNCFKSEQDGKKCAGFLCFKHTYSFCVQIVQIARSFFLFLWITWYTIFFCLRLFSVLIHFLRIIETANRWVSEGGRDGGMRGLVGGGEVFSIYMSDSWLVSLRWYLWGWVCPSPHVCSAAAVGGSQITEGT